MTAPTSEFLALQTALAGEYSLQHEIGRGGMGIVYLARDVKLDRDVAIKMLPPELATSPRSRDRFLREARTAAGLSHPNIVPIHRVGEADDVVYFVMAFVDGETLGERLRTRGPLQPDVAARILREVAWALAYAHGRGIVHRDIKPDNILLEAGTGRALVTDFGIAHGGATSAHPTDPGMIAGTANFMSPEQSLSDNVDGRSDIYSLGVVGFLAVTGKLPFVASNLPALMVQQSTQPAPKVALLAPGIPTALANAIDKCLEREPANRFADGEAAAAAFAPSPVAAQTLPPTMRAWLGARNPLLVPYLGWTGAMSVATAGNIYAVNTGNPGSGLGDVLMLAFAASLPIYPIIGFHLNQARRQFLAGHSLADLRAALEVDKRERAETELALARVRDRSVGHRALQLATIASATWLAAMFVLLATGVIHENRFPVIWILMPGFTTMGLGALSNALDVQFIPDRIKRWWQTGIRDRIWKSKLGDWFAKKLGAPERSRAVGAGVFRATEVVLGTAAADLFAALPQPYREQLADLPKTIAALEAHAAEARAELDVVAALAPANSDDANQLERRRHSAATHLAESVGALERIRIDLLRLHGGNNDLAPMTTLLETAREVGEDLARLADAEREVDEELRRRG
ncbi:MAG: serine/threonine-protein kinase [Gemmatimonas sp.]